MAFPQNNTFNRPAAAPAAASGPAPGGFTRGAPPPARPPAQAPSMWAGVQSASDRDPMLRVGYYRVRAISNEMGTNPKNDHKSFKGVLEVVFAADGSESAVGDRGAFIQLLSGDSAQFGKSRAKSYVVAAAGYPDDLEYAQFDPTNQFIEAVLGLANKFSEAGFTIVGRLVDVRVSRGKDRVIDGVATGDYFREYSWTVVPEAEQDQTPMPAWAPGAA